MVAELRGQALVVLILLTCGIDFLLFGVRLFGGILGGSRFQAMLGNPSPTMSGLVTAIFDIGCALGATASFFFGERLGRKRSIIYANVVVIIGAVIQATSVSYAQMFVARIIGGGGIGLSTVAVPILQAETLPARNRGALLVVQSFLIPAGIAISCWLCLATLFAESSLQWRFPIACQILFSIIVLILCIWLPESPRWLAKAGRADEARHTIARILDKADEDPEVEAELGEILKFIGIEEKAGEANWTEVFRNDTKFRNLHRVLLGMGPFLINQWSGINTLTYYLGYILQTYLGYSPLVATILAGVAFTHADAAAAVAFMFLYLDCYVLGFLPVSWSYSAEIQPLRVRNKATAVGVISHWISNFVVVLVTPIGFANIGGNFFWIWAIVCAIFVPIAYLFGVETSGRTLEQVDQLFFDNPRVLMGLDPASSKVLRPKPEDGEMQATSAVQISGGEKA
ncbi:hypothetical protein F5X68DRAFT_225942 [Plectosphaerella plurivora]|uniref:Major facilitator superfamily (MFS) profile domain-containing protein n=1 Tax=Plectosphaerella plurivora TaxID=936078 RepID=A0A9P8V0F0_9PEZI|nr:hypothetical protein F5X68DRAFT_225942 [Plectosphaerella plurivora]